ncbi:MAG: YlbE-like family protein [Bacilli bacterium]|nr:YlbE-like family protein [Bacilli bacterium]
MRDEIISKLYANEQYLDYLRRHPKWYYYLDLDPKYYIEFEKVVKKALKITTYDRLESVKNQVNFASAMIKYLANQ